MGLALSGVFSGIDSETIIAQLMAANNKPLTNLQNRKIQYESKQAAVGTLESRLVQLKDLVASLRGAGELRSVLPSTSDSAVATVTAASGAAEGVHSIIIDQLATGDRLVHDTGLSASTDTVGAVKSTALNVNGAADADAVWFTTSANGSTYTFDFGDEADITDVVFAGTTGYSMNQVAALINARSQTVSGYDAASVELDSQTNQYHLRMTAQNTATTGLLSQTLTLGDAIGQVNDNADWTKTAAGAGAFVYTYDGTTRTLNVTSDTTLENLRDLINNDSQNPGVTASILEYNSTYHLVLSSNDTGTDYGITIDNLATTLNGFDMSDFIQSQQAQNSKFRVDGYPSAAWMERSSNTVADVLTGVTLTLKSIGSATVTLSRDTGALKQDLNNLAAIYNGLVDKIDEYAGYDAENKTRGLLQGDGTISNLLSDIRIRFISGAAGFVDGSDTFTLPAQTGLEIDKEGHIELDETVFNDAVSQDYLGVLSLVGATLTGASDSNYVQFSQADETTSPGEYEVEVDFDGLGNITVGRIRASGESTWRALSVSGSQLTGVGGTAENGLVITAVWDGSSTTQTANVRVKQGFAVGIHERVEDLLDSVDGAVKLKKDQFKASIKQIKENIKVQERRLEAMEKTLRKKYARLEALLSQLDSTRAAFESLFQSIAANNSGD